MSDPVVRDPELGLIQVYREYIPKDDAIEYTTFFRVDGKKYRSDLRLKGSEFEGAQDSGEVENYVRNKIVAHIRAGNFVDASNRDAPVSQEVISKMREVPRDDKWKDEREANDARRDAYAVTETSNQEATESGFAAGVLSTGPSETELVIVALLMRLYDIQMAILSHFDKPTADSIYEAHEKGGAFNPPIFIPTPTEVEDA